MPDPIATPEPAPSLLEPVADPPANLRPQQPALLTPLASYPLTRNGRIDRADVPSPGKRPASARNQEAG